MSASEVPAQQRQSVRIEAGPCPPRGRVKFFREIGTTYPEKNDLLEDLMRFIQQNLGEGEGALFKIRLCLDEGLQNAFCHGNRSEVTKKIRVVLFEEEDAWGVTISDQGEGFQPQDIPDPESPDSLFREGGRGVLIMTQYMDEVSYFDGGRTLLLVKRKRREE